MSDDEQRGDARPSIFGGHKDAEWIAVQGIIGPITLWRRVDGRSTPIPLPTRECAEELWKELGGFLGRIEAETETPATTSNDSIDTCTCYICYVPVSILPAQIRLCTLHDTVPMRQAITRDHKAVWKHYHPGQEYPYNE